MGGKATTVTLEALLDNYHKSRYGQAIPKECLMELYDENMGLAHTSTIPEIHKYLFAVYGHLTNYDMHINRNWALESHDWNLPIENMFYNIRSLG